MDYLARYSHRIALTDGRIVNRDGSRHKIMTLAGEELIRHFLLHILPKASCGSATSAFSPTAAVPSASAAISLGNGESEPTADERPVPFDGYPCPLCRKGRLRICGSPLTSRRNATREADD